MPTIIDEKLFKQVSAILDDVLFLKFGGFCDAFTDIVKDTKIFKDTKIETALGQHVTFHSKQSLNTKYFHWDAFEPARKKKFTRSEGAFELDPKNPAKEIAMVSGFVEPIRHIYQHKKKKGIVVLLGHSWGGDSAHQLASMLKDKIDIDILVTLDPVSRTIKPKARPKPSAAGKWINVYANLSTKGPDNTIAKIGGPWGSQSNADVNKPSGARHREAQDMLNSVARDLLTSLLNIEKNKKKESTSNTQTA